MYVHSASTATTISVGADSALLVFLVCIVAGQWFVQKCAAASGIVAASASLGGKSLSSVSTTRGSDKRVCVVLRGGIPDYEDPQRWPARHP